MNYHPKHTSNSRTPVWIGAGVLAAVAIGAIIFIIVTLRSPMTKEEARAKAGIVYDSSAAEGGWDNLSPEEIEARLNEKVAEGMINISANTAPIFEDGSSEGNLMLVNESVTLDVPVPPEASTVLAADAEIAREAIMQTARMRDTIFLVFFIVITPLIKISVEL